MFLLALCFDLDCLWVALTFVCLACLLCSGLCCRLLLVVSGVVGYSVIARFLVVG